MSHPAFDRLHAMLAGLPDGILIDDPGPLLEFASAVYPVSGGKPLGLARPTDAAQVASIVEAARDTGVSLVPVSSGPPHIKGGSVPAGEGLVVDLSRMDRIVHFDRRNKVAVIEPGVTFGALFERAAEEGLRPLTPLLPRETKSVIGSYLEKEPTIIPKYQWDMTDPLLCVEVVFGTGDVFRTGAAAGPGTLEDQWALGNAQKNPMGPAATDLVKLVQGAQGTMGIVTWASVKLELEPAVRRFRFVTDGKIGPLLDIAREMLRKKLGDELLLLDSVDLSLLVSCVTGEEPVPPVRAGFTLIYSVAGYPGYLPGDRVAYQEHDIDAIARGLALKPARECAGVTGDELGKLLGRPCPGRHWKQQLGGACQDVFFMTTLDRVPGFIEVMDRVASSNDIEPVRLGVYIQPVQQGRSCQVEFNIFYDPADGGEEARARKAAGEASKAMSGMGAFFSRPYEPWVSLAYEKCADTVDALRKVKAVFDPADVMSRGKLCFEGGVTSGAR